MTDLENAQSLLRSMEACVHPAMREHLVKCIVHLLSEARREERKAARLEVAAWILLDENT